MSIEALLERHTLALEKNTSLLERVVAGQEAALAKLDSGSAAKPGGRARKTPETAPAAEAEKAPVKEEPKQQAAEAAETVITDDELRSLANGWLAATEDKDERALRGAFLKTLLTEFGAKTLVGPEGILDPIDRKKARFFLLRKQEGLSVDFSADYDFDGDPAQGDGEPEAAEEPAAEDDFVG